MNSVAMARHGLILNHNEAMGSRKVFKYLPGLRDTIKKQKLLPKSKNPKTPYFTVFSYIDYLGSCAGVIRKCTVCRSIRPFASQPERAQTCV